MLAIDRIKVPRRDRLCGAGERLPEEIFGSDYLFSFTT
jgi:hypothetical protein